MATLARPRLTDAEDHALRDFVERLHGELGPELRHVWLYGSRARGEDTGPESDVDLLVITAPGAAVEGTHVIGLMDEAAIAAEAGMWFSVQTFDTDWLADRRRIGHFFMQEVDRDRIALFGPEGGERPVAAPSPEEVRERTDEYLNGARDRLKAAENVLQLELWSVVVSLAYTSMHLAALALLSEEGRHSRTHKGTWHLFYEGSVQTGRFPAALHKTAAAAQPQREVSDYESARFTESQARTLTDAAREFIERAEALLGEAPRG